MINNIISFNVCKRFLESNGQVGTSLGLQCTYHPDSKTNISSPEDFKGLLLCKAKCGETLPCGHICDGPCHERDRYVLICSKRSRNNLFCNHETSRDALKLTFQVQNTLKDFYCVKQNVEKHCHVVIFVMVHVMNVIGMY
jgi:hypothetical protein